jgi:heme/copper-type cytochrome/quinol oxidase subunit 3
MAQPDRGGTEGRMNLATVQAKALTGRVSAEHHVTPDVFALYWHFVDGVWIFVFASLFVAAHIV